MSLSVTWVKFGYFGKEQQEKIHQLNLRVFNLLGLIIEYLNFITFFNNLFHDFNIFTSASKSTEDVFTHDVINSSWIHLNSTIDPPTSSPTFWNAASGFLQFSIYSCRHQACAYAQSHHHTSHSVNSISQTVSATSYVGCNGVISGGGSGEKCTACKQLTTTCGSVNGSADCTHVKVLQRSVKQDDAVDVAQKCEVTKVWGMRMYVIEIVNSVRAAILRC